MKTLSILNLVLVALAILAAPAFAQSEGVISQKQIAAAKEMVEAKRNMVVIANLDLTEEEGKEFWPLYEEYRMKIREVRIRRLNLIQDYAERYKADNVDDAFAESAIKEFLDIQADVVKVRQKYWKKFRRIIPATKAARFYQLESKMDAELDYIMAGGTPLIETK